MSNSTAPTSRTGGPDLNGPAGPSSPEDAARARRIGLVGLGGLAVILVVGLMWAKWLPYTAKVGSLSDTGTWDGSSIFLSSGEPGATPSLAGAWDFTVAYFEAVWRAVVVALVVAAGVEALVPRRWLVRALSRSTRVGQGAAGGLVSLPTMMCSCCTAPVAVGLRRQGVPLGATLAYWIGNPLLNPAVVVFLLLTLPWELAAVRVVAGVVLVVGGTALVARWMDRPRGDTDSADSTDLPSALADGPAARLDDAVRWSQVPARFGRALLRYTVVLVPEYVVVVLLVGFLSGWLSDFAGLQSAAGPVALLLVAVVAVVLVIPTGGEIPVVLALMAAGASVGVTGVLLVALPALSLPSAIMVARAIPMRATASLAAAVVVVSVAAGGALTVLL